MSDHKFTRRQAFGSVAGIVTGAVLAKGQGRGGNPSSADATPAAGLRIPPRGELVSVPEFEDAARAALSDAAYKVIAGGDRQALDRITLRQRLVVPTMNLDLSVELFGDKQFSPILVAPIAEQRQFHPDAELALVRGASAGNATVVVSSRSSVPLDQIAAAAGKPWWYQVYPGPDAKAQVQRAVQAGCKAVFITVGAAPRAGSARPVAAPIDWGVVDGIRQGVSVPIVVKGIMTAADARLAIQHGVQGIVVSNYGGLVGTPKQSPIEVLPAVVDAVAGSATVLADGGFRRGTDVFKALAFGARGVLVGRPAMWGLAAYGADGVRSVVEFLQTELARVMGMTGTERVGSITRNHVKVHAR